MTVAIDISATMQSLSQFVADVHQRQIPFATANAINKTLTDIQQDERARIHGEFIVRRLAFIDQMVKITQFATKAAPVGEIGIRGPNSAPGRADLLSKFEQGGTKTPHGNTLSLPIDARPNLRAIIPKAQRPKALLADPLKSRAFRLLSATGRPLILQRTGPKVGRTGRRGQHGPAVDRHHDPALHVLYVGIPSAHLPALLGFEDSARATITRKLPANFNAAMQQAIATAR